MNGKVVDRIEAEDIAFKDGLIQFWISGNIVAVTALGQGSVLRPIGTKS